MDDIRPDGQVSTALHSFDISDAKDTDYVASGRVKGTLRSARDRSPVAECTLLIHRGLWTVHSEGMNRYDLDTLDG